MFEILSAFFTNPLEKFKLPSSTNGYEISPSPQEVEEYASLHRVPTLKEYNKSKEEYEQYLSGINKNPDDVLAAQGSFVDYLKATHPAGSLKSIPADQPITVTIDWNSFEGRHSNLSGVDFNGVKFNGEPSKAINIEGSVFEGTKLEGLTPGTIKTKYTKQVDPVQDLNALITNGAKAQTSGVLSGWFGKSESQKWWDNNQDDIINKIQKGILDPEINKHIPLLERLYVSGEIEYVDMKSLMNEAVKKIFDKAPVSSDSLELAIKDAIPQLVENILQSPNIILGPNKMSEASTALSIKHKKEFWKERHESRGAKIAPQMKISHYPAPSCYCSSEEEIKEVQERAMHLKKKAILLASIPLMSVGADVVHKIPALGNFVSFVRHVGSLAIFSAAAGTCIKELQEKFSVKMGKDEKETEIEEEYQQLSIPMFLCNKITNAMSAAPARFNLETLADEIVPNWVVNMVSRLIDDDMLLEAGKIADAITIPLASMYVCYKLSNPLPSIWTIALNTILHTGITVAFTAALNNTIEVIKEIKAQREKPFFERISPANPKFDEKIKTRMFMRRFGQGLVIGGLCLGGMAIAASVAGVSILPVLATAITTSPMLSTCLGVPITVGAGFAGDCAWLGANKTLKLAQATLTRVQSQAMPAIAERVAGISKSMTTSLKHATSKAAEYATQQGNNFREKVTSGGRSIQSLLKRVPQPKEKIEALKKQRVEEEAHPQKRTK